MGWLKVVYLWSIYGLFIGCMTAGDAQGSEAIQRGVLGTHEIRCGSEYGYATQRYVVP